jgi:hypothetical protein
LVVVVVVVVVGGQGPSLLFVFHLLEKTADYLRKYKYIQHFIESNPAFDIFVCAKEDR